MTKFIIGLILIFVALIIGPTSIHFIVVKDKGHIAVAMMYIALLLALIGAVLISPMTRVM